MRLFFISLLVVWFLFVLKLERPDLNSTKDLLFLPQPLDCKSASPIQAYSKGVTESNYKEIVFSSNSFITFTTCESGTLSLSVSPSLVNNIGPYVTVNLNGIIIWEAAIVQSGVIRIPITEPGRITLAFLNDTNTKEGDRNLFVQHMSFNQTLITLSTNPL